MHDKSVLLAPLESGHLSFTSQYSAVVAERNKDGSSEHFDEMRGI